MNQPKSESFWLALLLGGIVLAMLAVVLTGLLVLPWKSNFALFQLPEKKPVPVIRIPEETSIAAPFLPKAEAKFETKPL